MSTKSFISLFIVLWVSILANSSNLIGRLSYYNLYRNIFFISFYFSDDHRSPSNHHGDMFSAQQQHQQHQQHHQQQHQQISSGPDCAVSLIKARLSKFEIKIFFLFFI